MAEPKFHGIDLGWMQAQWRDCADKGRQLEIFRDMTGRKATVQEILDAVGDPAYCGPMGAVKREYRQYTPEDDAEIIWMAAAGYTDKAIADALDRNEKAINFRVNLLRKRGADIPKRKTGCPPKPKAGPAEEPVPVEIVGDPDPEGVPVPSEVSITASFDGLEKAREELAALIGEEQSLRAQLKEVGERIARYRKALSELLSMAGGGLNRAEP